MAYTRRQLVTGLSFLYLIILTVGAGVLSSRVNRFSVTISKGLSYATALLPVISGLLLELGYDVTRQQERRRLLGRGETPRPPFVIVANTLIFIYSTVVATLLGTHAAPPAGSGCLLRDKWTDMFRHKNADAIRTIQQAFSCCGLKNSQDMPWPFPDNNNRDGRLCQKTFGHANGCLGPWTAEERRTAGLLMGVVGLVVVWQLIIIIFPTRSESWLHRVVPQRVSRMIADEEHGNRGSHPAILYPTERYTDQIENVSEDEDETQSSRAIEGDTRRTQGVLTGGENGPEEHISNEHENAWSRP